MSEINTDRTVSEFMYNDEGTKTGQVIPLFPYGQGNITQRVDGTISYQTHIDRSVDSRQHKIRKDLRDKIPFDKIRSRSENELIHYAYNAISDALDSEIDRIQRSNSFDEWKDTLLTIAEEVKNVSVNHRKILGAVIVSVKGKDIAVFTQDELHTLKEAAYLFRQLRVTRSDSKRTIRNLIGIGNRIEIPLAVDSLSDEAEEDLHEFMQLMIKRETILPA